MSLAANIRTRRMFLNWSQKQLAQRAGVSQQLINALEAERVRSSKFMRDIAAALGCAVSDLNGNYGGMAEDGATMINASSNAADLPIFGASETSDGALVLSQQPIDYIDRPEPLRNVPGSYGFIMGNDDMFPEYEPGDYALVNPHLPRLPDTTCLFHAADVQSPLVLVRRLRAISPEFWTLTAWQPRPGLAAVSELRRDVWPKCHRIVGRFCRR
jgi:transcriptional regulator with XRE-family HTH domain